MRHTAGPVGLVLTRQKLPVLDRTTLAPAAGTARGAYVLIDADEGPPEIILIATGSEVSLALEAHRQLAGERIRSRVVSMPSWELFEEQTDEYRSTVLPPDRPTLAVEAGVRFGWERYADDVVSIDRFGASTPGDVVMRELGMTPEHVVERALALLGA